jgi:hypothetical protein
MPNRIGSDVRSRAADDKERASQILSCRPACIIFPFNYLDI